MGQASARDRKCDVSAETVIQLDGAPPHFSHCVHAFLDRKFPYHWKGIEETHSLALLVSRFDSLGFFLLGVCKGHCLS
jgi:hypothetical protein